MGGWVVGQGKWYLLQPSQAVAFTMCIGADKQSRHKGWLFVQEATTLMQHRVP